MRLVVCIKHVPDAESASLPTSAAGTLDAAGWVINPLDAYALRLGLNLAELTKGTLTALSAGEDAAEESLHLALALGVDDAVLVTGASWQDDPTATARLLALAIGRHGGADIVFCGRQSSDLSAMQTPYRLAAELGMNVVSDVISAELADRIVRVVRAAGSIREVVEADLPCVLGVCRGSGDLPRASLPGVHVTGTVPDVRPYLAHAHIAVAPLRIARGIQNKVLEAMAMAKSVLVSSQALEGIDAVPGRELMVADSTEQFAAVTSGLLKQPGDLGTFARSKVQSTYSWENKLALVDALLDRERPHSAVNQH